MFFKKPKFVLRIKKANRQTIVRARLSAGFGKMVFNAMKGSDIIQELDFLCESKGVFIKMRSVTTEEATAAVIDSLL